MEPGAHTFVLTGFSFDMMVVEWLRDSIWMIGQRGRG